MTTQSPYTVFQSFLVREKGALFISSGSEKVEPCATNLVAAVNADFGQLGYCADGALMAALKALGTSGLKDFHRTTIAILREIVGAHVSYRPLFRNFPNDVPDIETYTLARFMGYVESAVGRLTRADYTMLSCGHLVNHRLFDLAKFGACPICQLHVPELGDVPAVALPLAELTPLKMLGLVGTKDVFESASNLATARTSLSDSQKGYLTAVANSNAAGLYAALPAVMPYKENATFVLAVLMEAGIDRTLLASHIRTPTDVLRLAVALCKGDVSLAENTRFKLSNGYRQFLLKLLEGLGQSSEAVLEEMLPYRGRWLRLGEVLHVGKFASRYPKVAATYDILRNKEGTITTFAGRVEVMLNGLNNHRADVQKSLLATLSQRPGEMARRLDVLLQRNIPVDQTLAAFKAVVNAVSTTTLLTLVAHFRNRGTAAEFRAFMPKGSMSKMQVLYGDTRGPLSLTTRLEVLAVVSAELIRRFSLLPALGKVYVADNLDEILVPFSQRSASSGMTALTRGSRMTLDPSKLFTRLFVHWSQEPGSGAVDVDLSVQLYDEFWNERDHLSWTRSHSYGQTVHSGDVRSGYGANGGCEFIDLDLQALRDAGIRYATVLVNSYTGQKFDEFPCFAGFMEREYPSAGENFEPRTVRFKFDVSSPVTSVVPMLLDVETGQVTWADLVLSSSTAAYNTVESARSLMAMKLRAVQAMRTQRVSVKDLLDLHVLARGTVANSPETADLVLDESLSMDAIVSTWL